MSEFTTGIAKMFWLTVLVLSFATLYSGIELSNAVIAVLISMGVIDIIRSMESVTDDD